MGYESWELDALEPRVIAGLIRTAIRKLIDKEAWKAKEQQREEGRKQLSAVAGRWNEITA